jgi:hypothetical protein
MANELINHEQREPEAAQAPAESVAVETPFCGSLRSKKFFMMDELATEAAHYLDSSNHCWCRETQQVVGPDGSRVHPGRCVPGRACYVSTLENF